MPRPAEPVRRLAVMAHYDPLGGVGPHARGQVTALAAFFDEVVVVSTATLTDEARSWLSARTRLIERDNEGYDFYSYKVGLDASDLSGYDEVVVCNDTYVLLAPYDSLFERIAGVAADFWGITSSREIAPHLQSYFVAFRRTALDSPAFAEFWDSVRSDLKRFRVIRRYEVGLTPRLVEAGLRAAALFEPKPAEDELARERLRLFLARRQPSERHPDPAAELREGHYNPTTALADLALDAGRLPIVKLGTLRFDPYGLGADTLLDLLEAAYPEALAGVREHLAETAPFNQPRPGSELRPVPLLLRALRRRVGYGRR